VRRCGRIGPARCPLSQGCPQRLKTRATVQKKPEPDHRMSARPHIIRRGVVPRRANRSCRSRTSSRQTLPHSYHAYLGSSSRTNRAVPCISMHIRDRYRAHKSARSAPPCISRSAIRDHRGRHRAPCHRGTQANGEDARGNRVRSWQANMNGGLVRDDDPDDSRPGTRYTLRSGRHGDGACSERAIWRLAGHQAGTVRSMAPTRRAVVMDAGPPGRR
jgi:hypothetical protein